MLNPGYPIAGVYECFLIEWPYYKSDFQHVSWTIMDITFRELIAF